MSSNSLIKAIDILDVNRITSGQVIIDLTSAVKELIDNSIDAEADQIDIIFKNYGIDAIECIDNGYGISEENFQTLTLKHYTSKLNNFDDIMNVKTLGFRGEALFSLCNISKLIVSTTTKGPKANKIEYDYNGNITSNTIISRNTGTTFEILEIFKNLPVRRKNFIKTIKKQFNKCITLLQSYSIINENIKFTIININTNGKKNIILRTNKNENVSKKILNIFGANCYQGLIPIELILDLNPVKQDIESKNRKILSLFHNSDDIINDNDFDELDYKIKVSGYISKSSTGIGFNSKDRQYIYINKRPIEYPILNKCFNEIFKNFNNESNIKYPIFFINFEVNPNLIDINVTPDKRTILLHNENFIIDVLKEQLVKFFESQDVSIFKSSTVNKRKLKTDYELNDSSNEEGYIEENVIKSKKMKIEEQDEFFSEDDNSTNLSSVFNESRDIVRNVTFPSSQIQDDDIANSTSLSSKEDIDDGTTSSLPNNNDKKTSYLNLKDFKNPDYINNIESSRIDLDDSGERDTLIMNIDDKVFETQVKLIQNKELVFLDGTNEKSKNNVHGYVSNKREEDEVRKEHGDEKDDSMDENNSDSNLVEIAEPVETNVRMPLMRWKTDINDLRMKFRTICDEQDKLNSKTTEILSLNVLIQPDALNFKAEILRVEKIFEKWLDNNRSIEKETAILNDDEEDVEEIAKKLTLTIKKKDFNKMKIVGQFNLGFIIAIKENQERNRIDLFIIDQHASDEKYNFENLQKTTVFKSQKLIAPQKIELNIIDELIVLDNLDVFEKNGFILQVNEDATPGSRVELISKPTSKKTMFDLNDLNELINLIRENDGIKKDSIRCSKIRSMFAMRACRMSIMIGKPLTRKTMTKVVKNLSTLDKPWNCPHGRPTMKHLLEVNDWESFTNDYEI